MAGEGAALYLVYLGAVFIAGAILGFVVNLDAVPSIWSGFIYEILLVGGLGVVLVAYGSVLYGRARRSRS